MPQYRRADVKGGTYFFTVATYRRRAILCEPCLREALRHTIRSVQQELPFRIDAWVLLPDHLHCLWTLPPDDADYPSRWARIKAMATQRCEALLHRDDWMTASKQRRREGTIWQRRYWEHLIRDGEDLNRHRDYIHWNPVKHGYVSRVVDWPYSTFHRYVRQRVYPLDWGADSTQDLAGRAFGE